MKITEYTTINQSSRHGWTPDMICCHQTAGAIKSAINWFIDGSSKTSAHFAVDKQGNVYGFVPIEKMAWANGSNTTDATLPYHYSKSLSALVRERKTNANFYTVSIEFENDDTGILTEAQYQAGLSLMKYIISEIKRIYGRDFAADREHIIGHSDINPTGRTGCPGKDFPFARFIADLNAKEAESAEPDSTQRLPLYCVQTGLYRNLSDAEDMVSKLAKVGFAAYITDMYADI